MDTSALRHIGLTESEIRVYFALLELESSTVGPIIERARVPDSKIYILLEKLKEKGLASFVIKNNVKHFQASDPKMLTHILDERQRALQQQKEDLETHIIPAIEKRRQLTEDKQTATVYESIAGMRSAYMYLLDALETGEEYQALIFGHGLGESPTVHFFREHHKRRENRGIRVRAIAGSQDKSALELHHPFVATSTRYTDQAFPVGLYLFKNHVMTVIWEGKKTAFILRSKQNYASHLAYFETLWKQSKPT